MATRTTDTGGSSGSSSSGFGSWRFTSVVVSSRSWWFSESRSPAQLAIAIAGQRTREVAFGRVVDKDRKFILRKGEKTYAS